MVTGMFGLVNGVDRNIHPRTPVCVEIPETNFADGGHAPLVPTAFGVFHYPPSGVPPRNAPPVFRGQGTGDKGGGNGLRPREEGATISFPSCSDLIGASTPQTGFGHNTNETLRSSRRATITNNVMLRPDRSIHLRIPVCGMRPADQVGGRRVSRDGGRRRILPHPSSRGRRPFPPPCPHPQRADTAKAVSPFSGYFAPLFTLERCTFSRSHRLRCVIGSPCPTPAKP